MGEHSAAGRRGPYGVPACRESWDSVDRVLHAWAGQRPDLDFSPLGVVSRLAKLRGHLEAGISTVISAFDLSPADFQVIITLRRAGSPFRMPQARLMDALELTSGTVSVRLDRLERRDVVVREPDPDNARSTLVRLTDKGVSLFDALAPQHLSNEDRLLSALTARERRDLSDLLRRLLSSYERGGEAVADHLGFRVESAPTARRARVAVGLSDTPGLLVTSVEPGSSAAACGLSRGDLIVRVDGADTLNTVALAEVLRGVDGGRIRIGVLRGDERKTLTLATEPMPASSTAQRTRRAAG